MDQGLRLGRVERRVPYFVAADMEVVVEKQPDLARLVLEVGHLDLPHQDVLVKIHGVVAQQLDPQGLVSSPHLGDH